MLVKENKDDDLREVSLLHQGTKESDKNKGQAFMELIKTVRSGTAARDCGLPALRLTLAPNNVYLLDILL